VGLDAVEGAIGDHVQVNTLCALGKVAGKQIEERLHFRVECLDGRDELHVIRLSKIQTFSLHEPLRWR